MALNIIEISKQKMKRLIFSFLKKKKRKKEKKRKANWVGTGQSDPESRPNLLNQVCSDIATLNKSYFNYLPSEYMQK